MKVGLMSDSHDNMRAISNAVRYFNDTDVSFVLHAGDLVAPFTYKAMKNLQMPFHVVFGNNDGERLGLQKIYGEKIHVPPYKIKIGNKKVLLMHEPDNLSAVAASSFFDLIVYGHTHEKDIREEKTLVVNPGECGGWVTGNATVAVWDTHTNQVEIVEI